MKSKYDIVIVGAGLIGATLALRLAQQTNFSIAVIERAAQLQDNPAPNVRVVALGALATHELQACGVMQRLSAEYCYPYTAMHVWDEFSSGRLEFNAAEFQLDQLGHMIDSVQCCLLLQQALNEHAAIDVFFNTQLSAAEFRSESAVLHFSEGAEMDVINADLVVAADGPGSWVRQQAKIFVNHHSYQQQGIVAKIITEKEHQDTAWQRFLEHGPIALLPVAQNQCSIVWSASDEQAKEYLAMPKAAFEEALAQALEQRLGRVELLSDRLSFPLRSQHAERYVTHHLALIGDAAHSIHPLAGQGANLGFKDLKCLVEVLKNAGSKQPGDLSTLAQYQRQRRADNLQTDRAMSALHQAFGLHAGAWLSARGLGMNIISQSRRLKQLLVEQAIGS